MEEKEPTPRLIARRRLWDHFKEKALQDTVRVKWFDGLRVDLTLGNDQSRCLYVCGSFEPNEFYFLHGALSKGAAFLDIGANEGFYTLFAAHRVGPGGTVIAVEPSPRERARLENNVRINRLRNVRIEKRALGFGRDKAILHIADSEHNGQNTLGDFAYSGVAAIDHIQVEMIDLDSLVREQKLHRVDVIKMDVEGAELEVLRGSRETLQKHKPVLLLEVFEAALTKQGASSGALLDLLRSHDYEFYVFDESNGDPVRMRHLQPSSQNMVAIHRLCRLRRDFIASGEKQK